MSKAEEPGDPKLTDREFAKLFTEPDSVPSGSDPEDPQMTAEEPKKGLISRFKAFFTKQPLWKKVLLTPAWPFVGFGAGVGALWKRVPLKIRNFVTHPTIWRVGAVVGAAILTGVTGGAAVPAIGLGLVMGTSLFSVVRKFSQMRRLEKLERQRALVEEVSKKTKTTKALPHYEKVSRAVGIIKPTQTHSVSAGKGDSSKKGAFWKTLRDVGLESAAPLVLAAATFNVPGTIMYAAGLVTGIATITGYAGTGASFVGSEFSERVAANQKKIEHGEAITAACAEAGIPPYSGEKELRERYETRMREEKALELVCKMPGVEQMSSEEINASFLQEKARLEKQGAFTPAGPSAASTAWRAVRPWGEKYETKGSSKATFPGTVEASQVGNLVPDASPPKKTAETKRQRE
jgi:hypothetical protein